MAKSCHQRRQELFLAMVVVLPLLPQRIALLQARLAVGAVVEAALRMHPSESGSLTAREMVLGLAALLLLDEKSCCWLTQRLGWYP